MDLAVALLACLAGLPAPPSSSAQPPGQGLEYRVKAAFLYNFARFVSWPDEQPNSEPLVIGVLGKDPFGDVLESTIKGKTVSGRPFRVLRLSAGESVADCCHILFVSSSERRDAGKLIAALDGAPVLTVGEFDGFLDKGGMIGFLIEDGAVRIDVNLEAAEAARLELSSQLMRVARTVHQPQRARP